MRSGRAPGTVADRRLDIEHLEHPLGRGEALLQRGVQIGQALHRLIGEQQRRNEREERARGAGAGDHLVAAVEDHDRDRRAAERLHHRRGARSRPVGAVDQRKEALDQPGGAALLVILHAVGLDVARALEGLAQQRRQLADFDLGVGRDPAHAPADVDDRPDRQRKSEERNQRQDPVLVEHQRDQKHDRHRVLADAAKNVGGGAAQQAASLVKREISVPLGWAWK